MRKCFLLSLIFSLLLLSSKAQTKKDTAVKITDSTALISYSDLIKFNDYLKKQYSYETYINFKPENILSELWVWRIKQPVKKP